MFRLRIRIRHNNQAVPSLSTRGRQGRHCILATKVVRPPTICPNGAAGRNLGRLWGHTGQGRADLADDPAVPQGDLVPDITAHQLSPVFRFQSCSGRETPCWQLAATGIFFDFFNFSTHFRLLALST